MENKDAPRYLTSYEHLFEPDPGGTALFRLGLLAAVIVHAAVFAITWPSLMHDETASSPQYRVLPFQIVKYLPPPPIEDRVTLPPRRVPIPDPDPFGPEPISEAPPVFTDQPHVQDLFPDFPDPPPITEEIDAPTVFEVGVDIDPPVVLHRVEPRYTDAALKIRLEGAVVLSLLINTDGRVADVAVLEGLPFGLTESAAAAVRQWRFQPGLRDGRPVAIDYNLTIRFQLDGLSHPNGHSQPSESAANPAIEDLRDTAAPPVSLATGGASLDTSAAPDDSSGESNQSDGKTHPPSNLRRMANCFAPVVDLPLLFASIVLFVLAGGAWIMRTISAALTTRSAAGKPIVRTSLCRWRRYPSRDR